MDELIEMTKDLKIKHSVFSPHAIDWETFFIEKLSMVEQTFLDKFLGNVLHGD